MRAAVFSYLLILALALTPLMVAQVTSSSVIGIVVDTTGRPIVNAEVVASDLLRGLEYKTRTDNAGAYRLLGLPPGRFSISATAPGFAVEKSDSVSISVDARVSMNFRLRLATVHETVNVTDSAKPLQTAESPEMSDVLSQRWIDTLPLNRRDFLQLGLLTAGAMPAVEGSELSSYGGVALHVNGGREEYNNFLLDGVDNNDPYVNRYTVQPPVDSVQEFKIATNSYSPEYGRSGGGQVNVITRRGTNNFHGTVYEYLRNRVFDANNYFEGPDPAKFIRNQFGFNVGGPLVPNKTFFFASTDFLRERSGVTRLATVPTAAQLNGDLSTLGATITDPLTGIPFPGNIIPPGRISPIATDIGKLFPPPNRPGVAGNYQANVVERTNETQGNYRVDHRLSDADDLTARYSFGLSDLFEPFPEGVDIVPGFGDYVNDFTQNAMLQWQHVIGARAVNSVRIGYNRFSRDLEPENYLIDVGKLWNVSWLDVPARDFGYPSMTIAGFSKLGDTTSLPILRHTNTYQFSDDLSLERGKHLLKLGFDFRALQLNSHLDLLTRGSLSFSGFISGSGLSDLLLGYPSFTLQAQANNDIRMRLHSYNAYAGDEWKLRKDLTLSFGVRYEYNTPASDASNVIWILDLNTWQMVPAGTHGTPPSGVYPDHNNFAPRFGFAWSPRNLVTVRGGYGIFYDAGMFSPDTAPYFNPPLFNLSVYFPSGAGLLTLDDPFPTANGLTPPPSVNVVNSHLASGYLQHWNLGVERSFKLLGAVSVQYVGSKGTHLIRNSDLNQPPPGPGDVQARRPHPEYGDVLFIDSGACSNYNALQVRVSRALSSAFSWWGAYTFSHSIDDASAFLGVKPDPNFPQNSSDLRAERGASSFDIRHRLSVAFAYQMPKSNAITRNTDFNGILTVYSGQPFTPVLQFDNSNTGNTGGTTGSDRPNLIGDPNAISDRNADHWFNTAAFAIAAPYTFGDAGRNILRGPGFASLDLSLAHRFFLHNDMSLQAEAQAFNVLNRTNFELPELYADQPTTFGKIFAAKPPRQLQFALRFSF